jgi:hypothetical protein
MITDDNESGANQTREMIQSRFDKHKIDIYELPEYTLKTDIPKDLCYVAPTSSWWRR